MSANAPASPSGPASPPNKKKRLSCAVISCLGCLGITVLGIVILVISLAIADACIDHSEKLISSSTDYDAFTKKSKVTFGPNVLSCEWALKRKDNRKLLSLSALVPSPSDYDVIISGFVVLPEEEAQRIFDGYGWQSVSQDKYALESDDYQDYLRKKRRYVIDVMGLQDRQLLYSEYYDGEIQQQGTPYDVMILFDPAHNTLFFHMTHM
ncbi:MAG: hypothetical protein J6Y92_08710 [Lentisphaeria bacterium]|nr:hypothetical protein [Lentisphaeria bacterium]